MFRKLRSRRGFIKGLGVVGGSLILSPLGSFTAMAEKSPCSAVAGRRIRWIVPHSVGGGYDTYARMIASFYEKELGAEIYIENVSGAGGIVGAKTISEAKPDGLTIGILNGSGLMVAALAGEGDIPNPADDFTVYGRIARSRHVWLTGKNSSLRTIDDVLKKAEKQPVVFATRDVGSISFVSITIASNLLDISPEIVAGYSGSSANVLAALRGDVDVISVNFESVLQQIENGDVRPIMQISDESVSSHSSLRGVPLLGSKKGIAAMHASVAGRNVNEAVTDASALAALIGAGRLIVAPKGLDNGLSTCMENTLHMTLNSAGFRDAAAKAKRSLDIASGKTAGDDLRVVTKAMSKFSPIILEAIQKVRG